jgi:hypothetical protein
MSGKNEEDAAGFVAKQAGSASAVEAIRFGGHAPESAATGVEALSRALNSAGGTSEERDAARRKKWQLEEVVKRAERDEQDRQDGLYPF